MSRRYLLGSQLARLRHVVEDISSELELEPLLTRIIEQACSLIGADDGSIGLYEPEQDGIRIVAVWRMPESELGALAPRGVGLAGRVLETGQSQITRYGDLDSVLLPELADHHVIGLPLHWRGEVIGTFGVGAWPPRRFDRRHVATLALFARHAAVAIVNARRYAEENRRRERFHLIARVAGIISEELEVGEMLQRAADAIHEVLDFPNVDIPLIDPKDPETLVVSIRGGEYKRRIRHTDRLPINQGIMGAAVRERRTQLVNDIAADPRYMHPPGVDTPYAELAVPIRLGDEVLGVLNVEGEQPFDELDAESLEIVSDHLALALNNARLFDASRQNAVLLERQRLAHELHDNVTQILSSINLLVESLPAAWRRDPAEGEKRSRRLAELAQTAFSEMRALLEQLQPPEVLASEARAPSPVSVGSVLMRPGGLPAALTRLLAAMVPPEIRVKLSFSTWHPQSAEHERALYLVCQEAVSNALRHAGAARLEIAGGVCGGEAWVRITDDGTGIDLRAAGAGIGLKSMRQRVETLGGRFDIRRRRLGGTRVKARLPRAEGTTN